MSTPWIAGYTAPAQPCSLATGWRQPEGNYPIELWPTKEMQRVTPEPTGWIVVKEHFFTEDKHGGTASILIKPEDAGKVLRHDGWIGRELGEVSVWDDGTFEDGLTGVDRDVEVEFFCQVRQHHDLRLPSVEISFPFLWYWDAIRDGNRWFYLNRAGSDEELVRAEVSENSYCVEVRALELRQYLTARDRALVVQQDYVPKTETTDISRVDAKHRDSWCYFTWLCTSEPSLGERPGFSRLLGQYIVGPMSGPRVPRWQERQASQTYPELQYGIDPRTGAALRHTCDPEQLGTYFDRDDSRLHYLTPVCFKREVLGRYTSQPSRYCVTATRLSCLDLWGMAISTNTAGLVEVYLGDLGRDLPPDEWNHWLGYNVAPEGRMAEDRFRRDFLNQPACSRDLPGNLRRARSAAAKASDNLLGAPVWKDLKEPERTEFDRLHAPMSSEPRALSGPVLTLTKSLVDAIDPRPLRSYLGDQAKDLQQLGLLDAFVKSLSGNDSISAVFKNLQRLRSSGGIAHLSGADRDKAVERMGIVGMSPQQAFDSICLRLTDALIEITKLINNLARGRA